MNQNKKRLTKRLSLVLTVLVILTILPLGTALADPSFVLDGFKTKWSRADKPVNDGNSSPARSWLWGPEGFNPPSGTTEPYGDSPGGVRTVEYFDKARMELNNPANGLVTNGLLVRELISGNLATSDAGSTKRRAADDIPVAGDPGGNNGPTYASFQRIATLNNDNPSPDRTGQAVNDTLSKDGTVGNNPALGSNVKYVYYDSTLKHNIPDVFWTFMNQRGNVYLNGGLQANQPVLGDNPVAPWLDAMGFPIADAYWSKVTVAGQALDVLIQPFERRVVTYTPSNPAAFQVEMGNVGRHYYTWRYTASYDLPPAVITPPPDTTPKTKGCADLPPNTANVPISCGPAGMQFLISKDSMGKSEKVSVTPVDPAGNAYGSTIYTTQGDNGRLSALVDTLTQYATGFWTYKVKGLTSGIEFNVYIWLDPPATTVSLTVTPKTGTLNTEFVFSTVGLKPDVKITPSLRLPSGDSATAKAYYKAGPGGGFFDTIRPTRDINPESYRLKGVYTYSILYPGGFVSVQFTVES